MTAGKYRVVVWATAGVLPAAWCAGAVFGGNLVEVGECPARWTPCDGESHNT